MSRTQILRNALELVQSHGFTRDALALSAATLRGPHSEPLSDTAISALFGTGDTARRTLIKFWVDEGRNDMKTLKGASVGSILKHRLRWNEPALAHLPEVRACLSLFIPWSVCS